MKKKKVFLYVIIFLAFWALIKTFNQVAEQSSTPYSTEVSYA